MSNIYQRHRRRVHKEEMTYLREKCGAYHNSILCKPTCNIIYNFFYKGVENEIEKVLKTPVYINSRYVRNDSCCTKGFRKYYENLLKGDTKDIKENCLTKNKKVLLFVNKKNLKIFLGYSKECGLYVFVKSPLLEDGLTLPCDDAELIEQIEDLKDELQSCNTKLEIQKNLNKKLLERISVLMNSTKFYSHGLVESFGLSRYDFMEDEYLEKYKS